MPVDGQERTDLPAFAFSYGNPPALEVHIFDAQLRTFHHPHTSTV